MANVYIHFRAKQHPLTFDMHHPCVTLEVTRRTFGGEIHRSNTRMQKNGCDRPCSENKYLPISAKCATIERSHIAGLGYFTAQGFVSPSQNSLHRTDALLRLVSNPRSVFLFTWYRFGYFRRLMG